MPCLHCMPKRMRLCGHRTTSRQQNCAMKESHKKEEMGKAAQGLGLKPKAAVANGEVTPEDIADGHCRLDRGIPAARLTEDGGTNACCIWRIPCMHV